LTQYYQGSDLKVERIEYCHITFFQNEGSANFHQLYTLICHLQRDHKYL